MKLVWTSKSVSDLSRLHNFLEPVNKRAAARIVRSLVTAVARLSENPRLGEQVDEFSPREVRRIFVTSYEIRYEIVGSVLYVLRIWHTREQR